MFDNFEDCGIYYANQDMIHDQVVLSMGSHLTYSIEDVNDVKIIKTVSDSFYRIAQKDIKDDGACFCGEAWIGKMINDDTLAWEF